MQSAEPTAEVEAGRWYRVWLSAAQLLDSSETPDSCSVASLCSER